VRKGARVGKHEKDAGYPVGNQDPSKRGLDKTREEHKKDSDRHDPKHGDKK